MAINNEELQTLISWCFEIIRQKRQEGMNDNPGGSGTGTPGKDGKSLEFTWSGSKLGIRVEGEESYVFTDLKGSDGQSPHIDESTGRWFIGSIDTNISAEGRPGKDGQTPNLTIGSVSTVPSTQPATARITGKSPDLQLHLEIPAGPKGGDSSSTDEKVKMRAADASSKYLSEFLDGKTIIIDTGKNVMKAVTLDGLETTITTLNFIKNLDKDIMSYFSAISNPMSFRAAVADDTALNSFPNPQVGDTFIVKSSASNGNKTMTFIYDGITYIPIAETSIKVRDFTTEPLNLATESTGVLLKEHIDPLIARLSEVLDSETYMGSETGVVAVADTLKGLNHEVSDIDGLFNSSHSHTNQSLLDSLLTTGKAETFLSDKGTYQSIFQTGATEPTNKGIFWIDTSTDSKPVMKFYNGTSWVSISSSIEDLSTISVDNVMSDSSENPIQNKVVKKYVDDNKTTVSAETGNSIVTKPDGLYSQDKTADISDIWEQIGSMNRAKKWVNIDTESAYIELSVPSYVVRNQAISMERLSGNIKVEENKIFLSKGKRYDITIELGFKDRVDGVTQNIPFVLKNITDDTIVISMQPYINAVDKAYQWGHTAIAQYTAISDCQLQLIPPEVYNSAKLHRSYIVIHEISRNVEIDPVDYVNTESGIEDSPVGLIIPMMSKNPPTHYLTCDGSIYNINDWPFLAQHIHDEFGSYNFFGGDGTTTFAVPDLRGEFLRGSGTSARNTGSGESVGLHQDPTRFPWFATCKNGNASDMRSYVPAADGLNDPKNIECPRNDSGFIKPSEGYNVVNGFVNQTTSYSSRPTNTSVLYCIKAEPTHFMKVEGKDCYSYEKHLVGYWVDGKPLYEKTVVVPGPAEANRHYLCPHGIINYDKIFTTTSFALSSEKSSDVGGHTFPTIDNGLESNIGAYISNENIIYFANASRSDLELYINVRWTEK